MRPFQPATRRSMVKARSRRVYAKHLRPRRRPAYPQSRRSPQSWVKSCAQTAIIPTNSVSDANAAASSTKIFNMPASMTGTYGEHCSFFVLAVKAKNPTTIGSVSKPLSRQIWVCGQGILTGTGAARPGVGRESRPRLSADPNGDLRCAVPSCRSWRHTDLRRRPTGDPCPSAAQFADLPQILTLRAAIEFKTGPHLRKERLSSESTVARTEKRESYCANGGLPQHGTDR